MSLTLTESVDTAQARLDELFVLATSVSFPPMLRDVQVRSDAFLVGACRHASATGSVLVGLSHKHLGREQAHRLAREVHHLELELVRLKRRLYGSAAASVPQRVVWGRVRSQLQTTFALEAEVVRRLDDLLGLDESERQASLRNCAERSAPTRLHPYSPKLGLSGRLARSAWSISDRVWDSGAGRDPVRRARSATQGLAPVTPAPSPTIAPVLTPVQAYCPGSLDELASARQVDRPVDAATPSLISPPTGRHPRRPLLLRAGVPLPRFESKTGFCVRRSVRSIGARLVRSNANHDPITEPDRRRAEVEPYLSTDGVTIDGDRRQ